MGGVEGEPTGEIPCFLHLLLTLSTHCSALERGLCVINQARTQLSGLMNVHWDPKQRAQVTGGKGTHRASLSPGFAIYQLGGSEQSTNPSLCSLI